MQRQEGSAPPPTGKSQFLPQNHLDIPTLLQLSQALLTHCPHEIKPQRSKSLTTILSLPPWTQYDCQLKSESGMQCSTEAIKLEKCHESKMNTVYWKKKKKKEITPLKSTVKKTVCTRFDFKKMLAVIHLLS